MNDRPTSIAIVGASAAGLTTAVALRRNGYDGGVTACDTFGVAGTQL